VGSSEFQLARPFVPGTEQAAGDRDAEQAAGDRDADLTPVARVESAPQFRSIDDFLDRSVEATAAIASVPSIDNFSSELDEESFELPPVEHFLDPLPAAGDFAPRGSNQFDETPSGGREDIAATELGAGSLAAEWANTDWQQYDWRSLAALGEGGESAASNAWATTDWDAVGPRSERTARDSRPTAAQAIAGALDQIAQRIRSGELVVGKGETDPATLAATLASILGIRH
jgi:hypothetical protein